MVPCERRNKSGSLYVTVTTQKGGRVTHRTCSKLQSIGDDRGVGSDRKLAAAGGVGGRGGYDLASDRWREDGDAWDAFAGISVAVTVSLSLQASCDVGRRIEAGCGKGL